MVLRLIDTLDLPPLACSLSAQAALSILLLRIHTLPATPRSLADSLPTTLGDRCCRFIGHVRKCSKDVFEIMEWFRGPNPIHEILLSAERSRLQPVEIRPKHGRRSNGG